MSCFSGLWAVATETALCGGDRASDSASTAGAFPHYGRRVQLCGGPQRRPCQLAKRPCRATATCWLPKPTALATAALSSASTTACADCRPLLRSIHLHAWPAVALATALGYLCLHQPTSAPATFLAATHLRAITTHLTCQHGRHSLPLPASPLPISVVAVCEGGRLSRIQIARRRLPTIAVPMSPPPA